MPPTELPALQLVRVPQAAPPYDCQVHGPGCPGAEEPAARALERPAAATGALVDAVGFADAAALVDAVALVEAAALAEAPAAVAAAHQPADPAAPPWQFAQVIVEIMAGFRSPGQLVALTTDRARGQVKHLAPGLASNHRPRIQRVVTSRPASGAVEMTVVVSFGPRPRALALRFEHVAEQAAAPGRLARPARWVCTAVEAG